MENTTRIVGTFKCPNGHVFETVQNPIRVTTCQEPECGAAAHRQATHFEPSPLVSAALVRLALSRAAEWLANPPPAGVKAAVDAGALVAELHGLLQQVADISDGVALEPKPPQAFDPDAHEIHALIRDGKIQIFIDKVPVFQHDATPIDKLVQLRIDGWMVVCHNDYRQEGKRMTFWSFANGPYYIKGEGPTDDLALAECLREAVLVKRTRG